MAIKIQNTTVINDTRDMVNVESLNGVTTGVETPSITSPADGATDQNKTVTITSSAFATGLFGDTHASSDWELATDSDFNTIVQSNLANTSNKTSWTTGDLDVSTTYYTRVRHNGTNLGASDNSDTVSFTTKASFGPTVLGESFEGGYYTGTIDIGGGVCYYLILAPNATGCACCQWKTTGAATTAGSSSLQNGYLNTYTYLTSSVYPAANFTATRSIGGYADWYLPARCELNVMYTNKGSMPAGEGYCSTGRYWASTEVISLTANYQYFLNGTQGSLEKNRIYNVRSIRREPI